MSKKSKGSLRIRDNVDERGYSHNRTLSTSSNVSRCSSVRSHKSSNAYDPLGSHPPMAFNASPKPIPEYAEMTEAEDAEREDAYHRLNHNAYNTTSSETSSAQQTTSYSDRKRRRGTYVYDQTVQWPLKDWQTIPPGLVDMSEADLAVHMTPRTLPTNHRRPPKEMSEMDMFVTRGDWKRRGIVFHLESDDEAEQQRHFEFPM